MNYSQKIIDLFPKVVKSFKKEELVYLSLTSKPERPIQDRYALLLNKDDEFKDKIFIKEYKRRDLVVFNENEELANNPSGQIDHVFEFKAGSASCFTKNIRTGEYLQVAYDFVESVAKDIANRKRENTSYAETIELSVQDVTCAFIAAEVLDYIPRRKSQLFQYAERHNRHLKNYSELDLGERIKKCFKENTDDDKNKAFENVKHTVEEVGLFSEIPVQLHLIVVQGDPSFDFESIRD